MIRGLYGAGEMTGLYFESYAGSTSVMRSITFGRIAGRNAIREVAIKTETNPTEPATASPTNQL